MVKGARKEKEREDNERDRRKKYNSESTEMDLSAFSIKAEYTYKNKEVLLVAFLDIEGVFNNTFLEASRRRGIDDTSCWWIDPMIRGTIMGETTVARVERGCHRSCICFCGTL